MRASAPDKPSWRRPQSFTVLIDVTRDIPGLIAELSRAELPLARVTTLQFFRMQIVAAPGPRLLIDWVYDGPLEAHLDEFWAQLGAWFGPLLQAHTELGPDPRAALPPHRIVAKTLHSADVRATAADVRLERALRIAVDEFCDEQNRADAWPSRSEAVRLRIRDHIAARADPELPRSPRARPSLRELLAEWLDAARAIALPWSGLLRDEIRKWLLPPGKPNSLLRRVVVELFMLVHGLWTGPASRGLIRRARAMEQREASLAQPEASPHDSDPSLRDELRTQNPLTMICDVQDHPDRRWILHRILRGANDASRHIWNRGHLAEVDTIHCARIYQIDGGRRMIFLSDYDGTWTRYLEDFLTVGAVAVVPIFANLQGCPPARDLFATTPGFGPRFLAFTRRDQALVQLWYSAWPDLSLRNRLSNARLREGLFKPHMRESEAEAWLREVL